MDPTKIPITTDPLKRRMTGRTVHKGLDFDVPFITQIADNLWQGGCEQGLVLPTHINYVVSVYPWERYYIEHQTKGELYIKMYDGPHQTFEEVDDIARQVNKWRKNGNVLVHCQAGLNRSSLIVARALMLKGMRAEDAINLIREKRSPVCLCNESFEKYLKGIDKAISV